jgi:hypothetical protein
VDFALPDFASHHHFRCTRRGGKYISPGELKFVHQVDPATMPRTLKPPEGHPKASSKRVPCRITNDTNPARPEQVPSYVVENMVGTRRLELLTSTVSR